MPCNFWASGEAFDVDAFLEATSLSPDRIFRRGETRRTVGSNDVNQESGFTIVVSEGGFDDFDQQTVDAIASLKTNRMMLAQLATAPIAVSMVLDFGVRWPDTCTHTDRIPAELVHEAGNARVAIHISHYPIDDDTSDQCGGHCDHDESINTIL